MAKIKYESYNDDKSNMANLSLSGTTKNVTPQISKTHPTSRQHKTHTKKSFIPIFLSKGYPNHVEFKNLIKCTKTCGKWMHKEKNSRM